MAHETTNLRMLVYIGRCVEGMEGRCGYGFEEVGFGGCRLQQSPVRPQRASGGGNRSCHRRRRAPAKPWPTRRLGGLGLRRGPPFSVDGRLGACAAPFFSLFVFLLSWEDPFIFIYMHLIKFLKQLTKYFVRNFVKTNPAILIDIRHV